MSQFGVTRVEFEDGGFQVFILYNGDMGFIQEAHEYLNILTKRQTYSTRKRKAISLTFFYKFLDEMNLTIYNMEFKDCALLEEFLRDEPTKTGKRRKGATIQNHFSAIRDYLELIGIKENPLLDYHVSSVNSSFGSKKSSRRKKAYDYKVNASRRKYDDVPRYLTFEEFLAFLDLANKKKDPTAVVLAILMFIYGLRIGECLGLTVEDVTRRRYLGHNVPVLILRNRKTDKDYQKAKTRMTLGPGDTYDDPDYVDEYTHDPYSTIVLTESMYQMLLHYIDTTSSLAAESHPKGYEKSIADIVSAKEASIQGIDENHYIFLNSQGKPLTDQTWNNKEIEYFKELDIEIDENVKENGLNHRWRHGTAMFLLYRYVKPDGTRLTLTDVQHYLRHENITTTQRYINHTMYEQAMIKTEFQESLFKSAPELKEMIDLFVNNLSA